MSHEKRARGWVSTIPVSPKALRMWADSVATSNKLMHEMIGYSQERNSIGTSIGAHPDLIKRHDEKAAELLKACQDVHDALHNYLQSRVNEK